jgi:hypothetical protein
MSCDPSPENLKINMAPYSEELEVEDDSSDEDEAASATV